MATTERPTERAGGEGRMALGVCGRRVGLVVESAGGVGGEPRGGVRAPARGCGWAFARSVELGEAGTASATAEGHQGGESASRPPEREAGAQSPARSSRAWRSSAR